jgi:protein-disulfide isomerase
MPIRRSLLAIASIVCSGAFVLSSVTMCRGKQPAEEDARTAPQQSIVELAGVDTSELTSREKKEWSALVRDVLAPCPQVPVSLAQCVQESRDCGLCLPAAQFLARQFEAGKSRVQAEQSYRARFAADGVKFVDLADSPWKGAEHGKVVVVEWADFECPACRQATPHINEIVAKHPEDVKLVFKHYPLRAHEHAEEAARAAVAAQRQGKFWEMHGALFTYDKPLDRKALLGIAKKLGLDEKQFVQDLESEAVADSVARDKRQADTLGLEGTPTIYINGRYYSPEVDDLAAWVALEAAHPTAPPSVAAAVAPTAPAAPDANRAAVVPTAPDASVAPVAPGANPAPTAPAVPEKAAKP